MPVFINTRPTSRANNLTNALQLQGIEVLELPLLEMISIPIADECVNRVNNLIIGSTIEKMVDTYDVLVVISPSVVHFSKIFFSLEKLTLLTNTKIIAVGQATADVLAEYGIASIIPKVSSNEGMLSLPEIQQLNHDNNVMVWRGQGGRQLLIDELEQRGVKVEVIEWYARQLPRQSLPMYEKWLEDAFYNQPTNQQVIHEPSIDKPLVNNQSTSPLATVLISSGEAFENWQLIVSSGRFTDICKYESSHTISLKSFNYIVLGERLVRLLDSYSLDYQKVDDLSVDNIRRALGQFQLLI